MNTGGPAFPCETIHPCGSVEQVDGLSIRDYFAAKAMQGLLSNPKLQHVILKEGGAHSGWIEDSAYAWADAMLKAREQ